MTWNDIFDKNKLDFDFNQIGFWESLFQLRIDLNWMKKLERKIEKSLKFLQFYSKKNDLVLRS